MSSIYFEYGTFKHPAGEVYPRRIELIPMKSPQGYRWASRYRFAIGGNFCQDVGTPLTPSTVSTKIAALEAAYVNDYQDFGFRFVDGDVKTPHYIETNAAANLSGNRIVSATWDYQSAAEFANTRTFEIELEAIILQSYSNILEFHETVSEFGDGGTEWTYRPRWSGYPVRENIHQYTPVKLVQKGHIVGLLSHPMPPAPWWPSDEHGPDRIITRSTPSIFGHPSNSKAVGYRTDYQYVFFRAVPTNPTPGVWYS